MANSLAYNKHDYVTALRGRLNLPTNWQEVMNVKYSDVRTIVNAALAATEPAVQTYSQSSTTGYSFQDFTLTADTLTINTYRVLPIFIDEADRYQQSYFDQMKIADYQGKKINEYLESQTLAQHASGVDFGAGDLANTSTDDTTQISVSATNVDDIVRAVKRKVFKNNGIESALERGMYIVWRPEDHELLEAFAQANGFNEADAALKNGLPPLTVKYLGVDNMLSTSHTANHIMAGVKKSADLGILRSTFGKVKFIEDPAGSSNNNVSGLGVVSRVDYGFSFPTAGSLNQLTLDVNVA